MLQSAPVTDLENVTFAHPKKVSIFGATGSVGTSTIDLIKRQPNQFDVDVLTANTNAGELAQYAIQLKANLAVIADESKYQELQDLLKGTGIEVAAGESALIEAAGRPMDWMMAAIMGSAGLRPTLAAIKKGTTVALANKEALVCAGSLMMQEVRSHHSVLLPVDSEHNAIFQVLDEKQSSSIRRIILTASGGPFRCTPLHQMKEVTLEQALKHPNWDMGAKISIDSATMMNKGLEFIEAFHLFPVDQEQIEILVHPQSVIHSMVEYRDGSILAQMGSPDMRIPISYALGWPERHCFDQETLDFTELGQFTFEAPDLERFRALGLAKNALKTGKSAPAILNAANEVAVEGFLSKRIGFLDIVAVVDKVLEKAEFIELRSLEDVFYQDAKGRELAREVIKSF
ncbi:1-deoxy-D-xylulose-5-phosphate reductoisomerase [Sneathiella limimaris]|uniref:1-deoxy-D-xylulose-5-phosphate reductoisomerase n=1 Tax=Sneathiella limimaris TaxID=1964213 RepID=UPI00146D400D|nr:1-deoxy-D-xylulose-5-phosphate reductoisomerase [Sneathiella limimaris]